MKIIISPAKKLNSNRIIIKDCTSIKFKDEVIYLINELRKYSVSGIKELMGLSDNLAKLNFERFKNWDLTSHDVCQAIYIFQGDVYKGLEASNFSEDQLSYAQKNLRIISGLYGLLKPLDTIYPYRLEMGTNLPNKEGKNLYNFWGNKIGASLLSEMDTNEVIVNLASNEYSKALNLDNSKKLVINPVFKDYKNGKLKVISFFAKRARGEMANFIITNKITDFNELRSFSSSGYSFSGDEDGTMLFVR